MNTAIWFALLAWLLSPPFAMAGAQRPNTGEPRFETSDRCLACHNGLTTASGEDVSIGFHWRPTMMANSARDPYWQAGVRRELIDHPESGKLIQDECSICHMPMMRYVAKLRGGEGEVFAHLAFPAAREQDRKAQDGVSCTVCHQVSRQKLGMRASFNGGIVVEPPDAKGNRNEYGPFQVEPALARIMRSSSGGFYPVEGNHIRESDLCGTCHTLYTTALGPGGKIIGELPEQMPYQEWLHSEFRTTQSCQSCHMPEVPGEARISNVLGELRKGVSRHEFLAGNFFMPGILNRFRADLGVEALPEELSSSAQKTVAYLRTQAARLSIQKVEASAGRLEAEVSIQNLGGHKLPTAYPSRRIWLHVTVRDANRRVVFESGALNPDGSIRGNDNDADGSRFEPHYSEIRSADQVQIYETIMGDAARAVTTGLLHGLVYLKDNRILPRGFNKATANKDVAVHGDAAEDPDFIAGGDRVRYAVDLGGAPGPFQIEAELWYQPIGFRWANNLKKYDAPEPRRFNSYYDQMAGRSALLARAVTEK